MPLPRLGSTTPSNKRHQIASSSQRPRRANSDMSEAFFRHRHSRCDGCFLALNHPKTSSFSDQRIASRQAAVTAEAERQAERQAAASFTRSPHEPATHHRPTDRPKDPPLQIDLGIDSSVDQVKLA
ncbi:hypothetical protein Trydic_g21879 [Trypoxylus dichotomus]